MPIPAAPPTVPEVPDAATEWPAVSITGGDGTFWDLSGLDGNVQLQPGWNGFDLSPVSTYIDSTPGLPGGAYQGSHDDPRPVFVPIYLHGVDRGETLEYRRDFLASIHHTRGPVLITVAEPSLGTRRYLTAVYTGGAEGAEDVSSTAGLYWSIYGLNFTAADQPYWLGDPVMAGPWGTDTPVAFFTLAPALFRLSGSQVLGDTVVFNAGDVDAYPIWTLVGPATKLTLQLGTQIFTINSTLTAGQSLIINTDPSSQTIVDGTGANRWGDVDDVDYDLWSLPRGFSDSTINVVGSSAATQLTMVYTPRFLMK